MNVIEAPLLDRSSNKVVVDTDGGKTQRTVWKMRFQKIKKIILIYCCHLSPPSRVLEFFFDFGSEAWAHAPRLLLGP